VRQRRNLTVMQECMTDELLLEQGAATGVRVVLGDGSIESIFAHREVILSAGAIGSPLLLERSGIGNAGRLRDLGIQVAADSREVGENLRDHLLVTLRYRLAGLESINAGSHGIRAACNLLRYALFHTGLLSGTPTELIGFARAAGGEGPADIQVFGSPMTYAARQVDGKLKIAVERKPGLSLGFYQGRPRSHGQIHLQDRRGGVSLVAGFLTDEYDRAIVVSAMRLCRRVLRQPAIAPHIVSELAPGSPVQDDGELLEYARKAGTTAFHIVGSCRMGADPGSVVDLQLRVRGIQRLRIVDASVMPDLVGANTHAPVVMIAERAADLIRGRAPLRHDEPDTSMPRQRAVSRV
jgi:choline dehydrogenase